MSKKRTSPESSNDEQTNKGSDSVFQQDDNAKRANLTLSDTTLQDLPMELIECILVKAVAMEVEDMHLARNVWKEKADLVISRLGTVCPQWSNILATNFFRNELNRTINDAAEKAIRLETLHQFPLNGFVREAITFKDELFMLRKSHDEDYCAIHVYDRNNVAEVKDVIQLPGIEPRGIAACSVSNCLYILNNKKHDLSVLRILKTDEHQFNISPFISVLRRRYDSLSVAANGSLFLSWQKPKEQRAVISAYDANGHLQYETRLSSDIYSFFIYKIILKSNGNVVMVSYNDDDEMQTKLTEIDMNGSVIRQYQSSLHAFDKVCQADKYGRILIAERDDNMELLDSEFNLLNFTGPKLNDDTFFFCESMDYNSDSNEIVCLLEDEVTRDYSLSISHFTEE